MKPSNRRHRVQYDSEGNIILSIDSTPEPEKIMESRRPAPARIEGGDIEEWIVIDEPLSSVSSLSFHDAVRLQLHSVRQVTQDALNEGARQYVTSIVATGPVMRQLGRESSSFMQRLWSFLRQPVWVPGRKKTVKQHSRGGLFLLDVVRFGGTFAVIFGALFVSLNYQSFWQISASQVQRVIAGPSLDNPSVGSATAAGELAAIVDHDARDRGDLLSFLPAVGPPDNRIIIPKLNLNVPLVNPSLEALLRQDWNKVESDIQGALAHGVVHYPGTARPGQAGNFFVTGHSSYYPWAAGEYKTVFARLHELQVGDEYWVYYGGDRHRYIVRSKREVSPSDVSVLDQPGDSRLATLMTCTPVGTTLRRLIVKAEEVDPISGIALKVGERVEEAPTAAVQLEALPI